MLDQVCSVVYSVDQVCSVVYSVDQDEWDINVFWFYISLKQTFSFAVSLRQWLAHFLLKRLGAIKTFQFRKKESIFQAFWSNQGFKGTIVSRALLS